MADVYKEGGIEKFRIKLISGILKWLDPSGNQLMKLEDEGTTGKLTVNTVSVTNLAISAAAITGGTIDGTTHGATTPIVSEITKALYVRDDPTLGPELVTDGDCEATPGSWPSSGTPTTNERSDTYAHAGTYSRKAVTNADYEGFQQALTTRGPGTRLKVVFWYYLTSGNVASCEISTVGGGIIGSSYNFATTGAWTSVTLYATPVATGTILVNFWAMSGKTFYIDDVSVKAVGGNALVDGALGVGGAATFNAGQVTLATAYPSASDRLLGAGTNAVVPVSRVIAQTTGDMADGFGPSLQFEATDSGASNKVLGGIGAVRDTADTEGKVVIYAGTAGAEVAASFNHDLLATLISLEIIGRFYQTTILLFTANDTTPSVAGGNIFAIPGTWTAGHNITSFDDGIGGQEITILGNDSDCVVVNGGNISIGTNWTAAAGSTLKLVFDGSSTWYQTSRF